ncbi:6,7-dimethyl-8-ribityllumazine synthase [Sediminibacterium sp.]|jgi:6,7-dimethyl-8-ribityllumazine synthase|uniref:6,7-dimethyl-8-ribityllumazine synthase n=1 Tax=Sediminibacterium sp. TaxID=1917865 RepID=UPI000BC44B67|nr:6,7-dimethyl-8-ribityllumazine synthase [Sediminibacterium sp.]MDP3393894.1 6,7-dimethyl-8-ribityllumazine synthase [Sediminibacterium sp.]MDP3568775.1 6,7-dimethyl-8-ribityllumazine synthase [Sediminibacterium sp.]OYZ00326.1 MAG: 6,7-dimethyl-8-ribityllumazine synthase [Sphingobacteriia bacterium 28-36-52]
MATKGNTSLNKGIPTLEDAFVVIIKTEWNSAIINALEKGARKLLKASSVSVKTLLVPGAFELPFAVKQHYAYSKRVPDAYIVLGAVIQGDTPHFDYVCKGVTDGIMQLNLQIDVPVIFGVLTVLNEQQAIERIGGIHGHKGEEAAITALKMIQLNRAIK